MLKKRASKLCHKRRRTDTKLENPLVWIHSRTAFYLPFDLREGEKHFFHEQKMAKLSGVAQGSGPSLFATNSSTEREDGEFVTKNARSLSGLSRRDEVVLWQDLVPGQFR